MKNKPSSKCRRPPDPHAVARALVTIAQSLSGRINLPFAEIMVNQCSPHGVAAEGDATSLMSSKDTAAMLGLSEKTLANRRVTGLVGLPHVKIGSRVFYRRSDVLTFIGANVRRSTSDVGSTNFSRLGRDC